MAVVEDFFYIEELYGSSLRPVQSSTSKRARPFSPAIFMKSLLPNREHRPDSPPAARKGSAMIHACLQGSSGCFFSQRPLLVAVRTPPPPIPPSCGFCFTPIFLALFQLPYKRHPHVVRLSSSPRVHLFPLVLGFRQQQQSISLRSHLFRRPR